MSLRQLAKTLRADVNNRTQMEADKIHIGDEVRIFEDAPVIDLDTNRQLPQRIIKTHTWFVDSKQGNNLIIGSENGRYLAKVSIDDVQAVLSRKSLFDEYERPTYPQYRTASKIKKLALLLKKNKYTPQGKFEKVIGEISTQQGGTNLSKEDFEEIKSRLKEKGVTEESLDKEDTSEVYKTITQVVSKYLSEIED